VGDNLKTGTRGVSHPLFSCILSGSRGHHPMKTTYIFLAFIAILMYNGMLAKRDAELFRAYDKVCAELSQQHPDCKHAK